MKKLLVLLLSICCCFAFVACNGQGDSFAPSSENESSEEERSDHSEEENNSEEENKTERSGGKNGIWSPPIEQE